MGRRCFGCQKPLSVTVLAALLVLFVAEVHAAAEFTIRWVPDPLQTNKIAVEVLGLNSSRLSQLRRVNWTIDQWQHLFSVKVYQDELAAELFLPNMLGAYSITNQMLRFDPQFAFQRGVGYRAIFRPHNLPGGEAGKPLDSTFMLPGLSAAAATVVTQVFPSADKVPENLLKFYVHFSAPMRRGDIYDYIRLTEISGRQVELPFLQIDEELWNSDMTRLTLFIDPGRIKRGVRPLEEVGPALEAGKKYELIIDHAWKDAAGNPLKAALTKTFSVGPPDRTPVNPSEWKIEVPKSQTLDLLAIRFPKPMDHALALRMIQIVRASGEPVSGTKGVRDQEQRWVFTPDAPWTSGTYAVTVQTTIEDLAGNNIGKAFEVDLFEGIQRRFTNSIVKLPFVVR